MDHRPPPAAPAPPPAFVGIDVAKDRLDVHLRPSGRVVAVPRETARASTA